MSKKKTPKKNKKSDPTSLTPELIASKLAGQNSLLDGLTGSAATSERRIKPLEGPTLSSLGKPESILSNQKDKISLKSTDFKGVGANKARSLSSTPRKQGRGASRGR